MVMVDKAALDSLLKVAAEMNDYIDELDDGKPSSEDRREYVAGVIAATAKGTEGLLAGFRRLAELEREEMAEARESGKLDLHLAHVMADEWYEDPYWCNFDYCGNSNRIVTIEDAYEQRNDWVREKASSLLGYQYQPKIVRALQRKDANG